jgi:MFS family permease
MNRVLEIVLTTVWTAGLILLWVVMIAAILLPFTWLADWWLGDDMELFNHPRRNAIVLGAGVMALFIVLAFSPARTDSSTHPEQVRWWQRRRP